MKIIFLMCYNVFETPQIVFGIPNATTCKIK